MRTIDIDAIGVPAFIVDVDDYGCLRFGAVNAANSAATGLPSETLVGRTPHEALTRDVADHVSRQYGHCARTRQIHRYDEELDLPGGKRWWHTTLTPVIDANGNVVSILGFSLDITAERDREDVLRTQVFQDPLSGVGNRRYYDAQMADAVAQATQGQAFSLLLIDVDDFKAINDRHGHAVGDGVVRSVARRLLRAAGGTASVSRIGGDEFAIIAAADDRERLEAMGTRVREAFEDPVSVDQIRIQLGISIGAALWTKGSTKESLALEADRALYDEKGLKRLGRVAANPFDHPIVSRLSA